VSPGSKVLIVTGMHRSGTSLVANYLAKSGVHMGSELIPADVGNPHGYYEDAVIHDFHRRLMRKAGITDTFTVTKDQLPLPFDDADVDEARAIVAEREGHAQWGWKEPRTTLYLDLWSQVLPDATYLFLFRKPDAVLDSLMRRASNESVTARPATGLELWLHHNNEMLRFWTDSPKQTIWFEADEFVADPEPLLQKLRESGFELSSIPLGEVKADNAFHQEVRMRAKTVTLRSRGAWKHCTHLYEKLRPIARNSQRLASAP
jgi:hypothetical protein